MENSELNEAIKLTLNELAEDLHREIKTCYNLCL